MGNISSSGSSVYRAYWRGFPVVVRFPNMNRVNNQVTDEDRYRHFLRQCRISDLVHPNIITCYGCCTGEKFCTVVEYMNLGNLQQFLCKMPAFIIAKYLPRIAVDVARAMEHIHLKGITHGRLKSSNILLKGQVVNSDIIGFEVKVDIDIGVLPTEGNEDHMGPFLAMEERSRVGEADVSADIFSYGMILTHLFSEREIIPKSLQEVCRTSAMLSTWDSKWKELIVDCTEKDPTERPHSFSSVLAVLMQLNKAMPTFYVC